ncbi:MAG: endolytic transglycosylase MltG [Candidatus Shapirobacteria bacterium]
MKRLRLRFAVLSLASVLLLLAVVLWWCWAVMPINGDNPRDFVVRKGEAVTSIAQRLEQQSIIRSAWAFRLIVWQEKLADKLQAGKFVLNTNQRVESIAQALTQGTQDIWLTFPEGWRKEEVAARLAANLPRFDKNLFLLQAQEGYLFPDTYLVPQEADEDLVLRLFADNFVQKFTFQNDQLNQDQILILASLVEREAKKEVDRPIVAGILLKRWQNGWPLQVDATVQYAKANSQNWWPTVSKSDLKTIKSPYNTYLNKGLPLGPICNPGLAAIKAVVNSQATEYWYYLTGTDGLMHYAVTAADHQQNIQKYL